MPTLERPPTINLISECYDISRQRLHELRRKYSIGRCDLCDPDRLFEILLDKAPASPLRTRLSDPNHRAAIKLLLTPTTHV